MIDSIFYYNISFDNLYTSECHHSRYRISVHLRFPDFSSFHIFSFSIELESFFIGIIHTSISDISLESKEFKYSYSFSFSFYCDGIQFSKCKEVSDLIASSLGDDNMHIIFFTSCFKSRSEIHGIPENSIVEVVSRSNISYHHVSTRYTDTEAYCLDSFCSDLSIEFWKNSSHLYGCSTGTNCVI